MKKTSVTYIRLPIKLKKKLKKIADKDNRTISSLIISRLEQDETLSTPTKSN